MKITAIILAGGRGTRLGGDIPKQYIEVAGKPVLLYALESFEQSRADGIVIVCGTGDEDFVMQEIVLEYGLKKVTHVVRGGAERYDSVYAGLLAAAGSDYVLIHDGARPYITAAGINRMIDAVLEYRAAVAAQPSKDTIKITDEEGFVQSTTDRSRTWNIQTPQCFRYEEILDAYEQVIGRRTSGEATLKITDDAMVYETVFPERRVKLVDIGEENGKITTSYDLEFMKWKQSQTFPGQC